ncbi:hypothetical protein EDD18DRAFT_1097978 [Armillaria luteobubalina]|uniref:Uncharacterized protein n=1 Tax=Armillaria luteobubalina TaxID=153913 RepID=A0AA39QPG5_9AGAR|nr:hypothetical protein EDD18DRAFT_1097978 [Armillaria luteobubalina]
MHLLDASRTKTASRLTYEFKLYKRTRVRRIKTRASGSSRFPDADRKNYSDWKLSKKPPVLGFGPPTPLFDQIENSDGISVEREAAGNQETFKPQEQGSAILVLGGILRLLREVSIFEQALSDRPVTLLPFNREVRAILLCDAVAGLRQCTRVRTRTRAYGEASKIKGASSTLPDTSTFVDILDTGEEVWQMDAFDQNSELEV